MNKTALNTILLIFLSVLATSCGMKQYELPKEGEPAALIKLKTQYNQEKALELPVAGSFNRNIGTMVNIKVEDTWYRIISNSDSTLFTEASAVEVPIHTFKVHPDKPIILSTNLSVNWQTQKTETVWETKRVPKQVTEWVREKDYHTGQYRSVQKTKTVYEQERYQVTKPVTRNHTQWCGATVSFLPENDNIYLLDFTSPAIDTGCSMSAFKQTPDGNGKFKLEIIEQEHVEEVPQVEKPHEPEPVKAEDIVNK